MAVNHLVFQGRFVEPPTFGQTTGGTDYANFRLAWSEKYKDKENKCFLECKALGSTAKFMSNYMKDKGQEIIAEGKLQTEEWGEEGHRKSKIVLLVGNVHFCGKRQEGGQAAPAQAEVPAGFTQVEDGELPF